ncbi:MAG TPA: type IV toxin-antitoxin system AbiEi family antitoxin domain-containing protein [Acidimicrobiia bacterium]|nr:type IV toxin-antitoxin system AbiEi family antitoxin domain-containing protein [Acidimicrobiia bacterium]
MRRDLELGALAASQASFISGRQAAEYGLSPAAIRWRLQEERWTRVRNGLYQVNGMAGDLKGLLRGAAAILPNAAISHESAAELLGIPMIPKGKAVVTVHARTTHGFPGVTVHRSLDLAADHIVTIDDLRTTNVARTLVDLAAVCKKGMVARAMDEMLASGRVRIDELVAVFEETARPGRTGSKAIRELLSERVGDELVSASKLEQVGMDLFDRGGIPRPEWQFPAPWNPDERIDFAWPPHLAGVEGDGRRWHTRVADFERDRRRDRLSLLHRWTILRFTWFDFTKRPDEVLSQVRQLLELRDRR